MAGVAALLAVKIALAVAARPRRIARSVLRLEALHRRPRRNLRAVDREVLVRQQPAKLLVIHQLGEELARHVGLEQPVAVLREHRRHPHRIVDPEPDEPAVEQVVIELLHQLTLRADRVERLQQQRPQQPFGRDRRTTSRRVSRGKIAVERSQHVVHHLANQPQRMLRRHPLLKVDIGEQLPRSSIRAPHSAPPRSRRDNRIIFAIGLSEAFFSGLLGGQEPKRKCALARTDPWSMPSPRARRALKEN